MTRFELLISGIMSVHSANCTTANRIAFKIGTACVNTALRLMTRRLCRRSSNLQRLMAHQAQK